MHVRIIAKINALLILLSSAAGACSDAEGGYPMTCSPKGSLIQRVAIPQLPTTSAGVAHEASGIFEQAVQAHSERNEPIGLRAAWWSLHDLLRAKLEAYLNRNRDNTTCVIALAMLTILVQGILATLVAQFYLDGVRDRPEEDGAERKRLPDLGQWSSSLVLDWCQDPKICFWSCFCPCIRWADTLDTMGIMGFWSAFSLSVTTTLLTEITYGLSWWMLLLGLVYFRRRFRKKFKMDTTTYCVQAADCLGLCCCLPCALAQEARHAQAALRAGHGQAQEAAGPGGGGLRGGCCLK